MLQTDQDVLVLFKINVVALTVWTNTKNNWLLNQISMDGRTIVQVTFMAETQHSN